MNCTGALLVLQVSLELTGFLMGNQAKEKGRVFGERQQTLLPWAAKEIKIIQMKNQADGNRQKTLKNTLKQEKADNILSLDTGMNPGLLSGCGW
ncbi:hypothetical protein CapIbe_003337 [Capra ibex]